MHPTPYLFLDGSARAAAAFYAEVFGAEVAMLATFAEMPPSETMQVPPDRADRVMHAALRWPDGGELMLSDTLEDAVPPMAGAAISMALPDLAAARTAFDRLSEGGTVTMPFGPTFWTEGFGAVTDRFGTSWMVTIAEA